jgi:hypothetical protein
MKEHFQVSPAGHANCLRINPSNLNLTAINGNYAGPTGQAFVGRRQQDTLFTYSVTVDFNPTMVNEEAGVTAFLTQNHHLDLGVVMLPAKARTASFPGDKDSKVHSGDELLPHFRFRGMSYVPVPADVVMPVPAAWVGSSLRMEISAKNMSHYSFSAGPADAMSEMHTVIDVSNEPVSWGFTGESFSPFSRHGWPLLLAKTYVGVLLGVYATSNGGKGSTPAYISEWKYSPQGQFRD